MKSQKFIYLLLALVLATSFACSDKTVEPTIYGPDGQISVDVRGQFTISLEIISGTGYGWYFIEPFDSTMLTVLDHRYVDYPDAELLMGRPMLDEYTLLALRKGTCTIRLEHRAAWDLTSATDTVEYWVEIR